MYSRWQCLVDACNISSPTAPYLQEDAAMRLFQHTGELNQVTNPLAIYTGNDVTYGQSPPGKATPRIKLLQ